MLMPPLQLSAATGGAALVSSLLHVINQGTSPVVPPLTCQDLLPLESDRFHFPSLVLGVLLGFILAYIFEYLALLKHYLQWYLRQKTASFVNSVWIRGRLG